MKSPENLKEYDDLELKLGIKSSLPGAKSALALLVLLWESYSHPSKIVYGVEKSSDFVPSNDVILSINNIVGDIKRINADDIKRNPLYTSQIEALKVGFELIWKLAKFEFLDKELPFSAERTGGKRYVKEIHFTSFMDVISLSFNQNIIGLYEVLLGWLGVFDNYDREIETKFIKLLTIMSEFAIFKMTNKDIDITFNQNGIYNVIDNENDEIDLNSDVEAKGTLRILKSLLKEGLNYYLDFNNSNKSIMTNGEKIKDLELYRERVDVLLSLLPRNTKIYEENNNMDNKFINDKEDKSVNVFEIKREKLKNNKFPLNFIVYGAPGTSKTYNMPNYAIAIIEDKEIKDVETDREKLIEKYKDYVKAGRIVFTTFHQNYGYEDFIEGLRPDINSPQLSFKTVDGVFKKIADKAMQDNDNRYVIIIDEINRGNISKIFGELITLIEEDKRWGEENEMSATLPSGRQFAVPNNLYIIGTMNSADKSISLIDAALRRRFDFEEMIPDDSLITNTELKEIFKKLNKCLFDDLDSTDLLIGHSYFINKSIDDIETIMNNRIIPLLYEYFYDNRNKVRKIIEEALGEQYVTIVDNRYGRLRIKKNENK